MAVAGALIFEGDGLDHAVVRQRLQERLHLIPRYRQRLEQPALGLANPVWVDDSSFDVDWHVRRAQLASPAGDAELAAFIGHEMSRRLDRARPLWELHVIERMAGGRVALVPKMHHALVDGVGAIDVGTVLLDPTPEPLEIPPPPEPWQPEPYDRARHLARLAATPVLRGQKLLLDSAARALDTSPRQAAEDLRRSTDLLAELARSRPQAPMTPLNSGLGPNRRWTQARAGLEQIKRAARSGDGKVNDVLLAIVAGMLRRYLDAAGVQPERDPVALVPVSVRADDETEQLGNRISTVFVDLPIGEDDPVQRVRVIAEAMRELKQSSAVRAGALMVGATGWAPPLVSSVLVRAVGGIRAFNLVVSNVPGPQQTFYLQGARLLEAFPVVPLNPANQGLTVGILSYDGGVHFGLLADGDLDPGLEVAAAALDQELLLYGGG